MNSHNTYHIRQKLQVVHIRPTDASVRRCKNRRLKVLKEDEVDLKTHGKKLSRKTYNFLESM